MSKILVIDDEPELREFVAMSLELNDYDTVEAENGKKALEMLKTQDFDCVISDVEMPEMTGPEFLKNFRDSNKIIPVIMLTGVKALNTVVEVMKLGAQDYLVKPINIDELLIAVRKSIEFKKLKEQNVQLQKENERYQHHLEEMVEKRSVQLKDALFGSLIIIASAIEAKDEYTKGHSNRVRLISIDIGKLMGLDNKTLQILEYGAMMHDVGKIGVKDAILHKNKSLTEEEFDSIMSHPAIGANIVRNISFFGPMTDCIKYHHEKYSGKGYPSGLKGEDIPLLARIVAVADTYDAITTTRPYRKEKTSSEAVQVLVEGKGTQFDPFIVDIFVNNRLYEKNYIQIDKTESESGNIKPSTIILDDENTLDEIIKPKKSASEPYLYDEI
ncbi:MAG TPA: response regulator [Clostridiales bacterium]|jgi:putative two-component system response regulator|nr:response regulator [Clostridiales bacterium]HQP70770.1 response regulator [Clostridiales bacterium]